LQSSHSLAFDLYVTIPPIEVIFATVKVPIGNIDAANKTYFTIYDNNFAMIPIIDTIGKLCENDRIIRSPFYPIFPEFLLIFGLFNLILPYFLVIKTCPKNDRFRD